VTGAPAGTDDARAWPAVAGAVVALAALTGALLAAFAPSVSVLYGLALPSATLDAGLPAARVLAVGAAVVVVAQLLVAAVLAPGEPTGTVSPAGYTALRRASAWSVAQAVASAAVAALTVAENSGMTPGRFVGHPDALVIGLGQIAPASGWLLSSALALAVAGLAGWTLSWRGAVGALLLALAGLLPAALTAATNADRSHDIAGDALTLHVLGAVVWSGSALATGVRLWTRRDHPGVDTRRHAAIAAWCLPVVGLSGLVSSAYAVSPADLLSSGFGVLVLISAALLAGLSALAVLARRAVASGAPQGGAALGGAPQAGAGQGGGRQRAMRLVGLELGLLAAAAVAGTGLTRLVPPAEVGYSASRYVYLVGYDLPDRLTGLDLAGRWRPDLVFGTAAVLGAAGYLLGVRRVRRRGDGWPVRYTVAWLAGCAVLLVATCSGLGLYAPAVFSVHMVQHMLLATMVPVLLVLGHGASLVTRVSGEPVRARWLALLDSPPLRLAANPLVAWCAVAVTLFGLYATGLYAAILQQHWAHLGMNAAFLGTGLALFWPVLGRSAARDGRGLPALGQMVMVFAVMGLHAGFSAWLLGRPAPVAEGFYTSLRLPYVPDLLADQRLGVILGWALAEVPVILAVVALMVRWTRDDRAPVPTAPWALPARADGGSAPAPVAAGDRADG
jgi:putative copper resistance protein D